MARNVLITILLAIGFYLAAFVVLILINGIMAAGLTDQEYARSATLAAFTLASKGVLAIVVGIAVGWRLARQPAAILAGVLMFLAVFLGHLLPGGGLIFSVFSDDLLGHQGVAIAIAVGIAWLIATSRNPKALRS